MAPLTLTAADVMTAYPHTIQPETLLADAAALMQHHGFRHLPVLDSASQPVGMLSDADIRTAIGDPARFVEQHAGEHTGLRVLHVMTKPTTVVPFDQPLRALANTFAHTDFGALPVVDAFGAVIGIVSYVDLMRRFAA